MKVNANGWGRAKKSGRERGGGKATNGLRRLRRCGRYSVSATVQYAVITLYRYSYVNRDTELRRG